jgi:3-oxoadipate enol-lactonase
VGEQDAITPVEGAKKMHEAVPKSRLAVIGGAGHMSPMEKSDEVNRVMGEFLRECEERTVA